MEVAREGGSRIELDLSAFKLHVSLKPGLDLTLHFDSPSRRFYLSLIALVLCEAKQAGGTKWVPLRQHIDALVLLNETVGEQAGSSNPESLLGRIYRKWKVALPDLANAPLFRVLGKHGHAGKNSSRAIPLSDAECDLWANLFEYRGSEENVQLRFAVDRLGIGLDEVSVCYRKEQDADAWGLFVGGLSRNGAGIKTPAAAQAQSDREQRTGSNASPDSRQPTGVSGVLQRRLPDWSWRWVVASAVLGVLSVATFFGLDEHRFPGLAEQATGTDSFAYSVPAAPVIAVLPFASLSGEDKDALLAAGFVMEIVSALSRVPDLAVVMLPPGGAQSDPTGPAKASLEAVAQFVLQGSLGRVDDQLRAAVQLIEVGSGRPIWAQRFDRTISNLFAVQDEITMSVMTALQVRLSVGEHGQLWSRGTKNPDAYLKYLEAISLIAQHTKAANARAQAAAAEVIGLDPQYARGYKAFAQTHLWDVLLGSSGSPEQSLKRAMELAQRAVDLDGTDPGALGVLASCFLMARQHDRAIEQIERAVSYSPKAWDTRVRQGFILLNSERPAEAIEVLLSARRTNPNRYVQPYYYLHLTAAYRLNGEFARAIRTAEEALRQLPENLLIRLQLAAAYQQADRVEDARAQAVEVLRIDPSFTLERYARTLYYRDPGNVDGTVAALRAAGLR